MNPIFRNFTVGFYYLALDLHLQVIGSFDMLSNKYAPSGATVNPPYLRKKQDRLGLGLG